MDGPADWITTTDRRGVASCRVAAGRWKKRTLPPPAAVDFGAGPGTVPDFPVFQHTWPMETIDLCCEASARKAGGCVPRERTHGRPGARGRPPPTPRPAAPVRAPDRYLQRPHARTCSAVLLDSRFDSAGARRFYQANNTVKYSQPLTEGWLSSPGKQCKDDIHSTLVFSLSSTIVNAEWLLLPH
jgi:hypothetical protein